VKNQFSLLNISREQRDRMAVVAALAVAATLAVVLLKPVSRIMQPQASIVTPNSSTSIHFASKQ